MDVVCVTFHWGSDISLWLDLTKVKIVVFTLLEIPHRGQVTGAINRQEIKQRDPRMHVWISTWRNVISQGVCSFSSPPTYDHLFSWVLPLAPAPEPLISSPCLGRSAYSVQGWGHLFLGLLCHPWGQVGGGPGVISDIFRYSSLRALYRDCEHLRGLTPPFPPKQLSNTGAKVTSEHLDVSSTPAGFGAETPRPGEIPAVSGRATASS